MRRAPISDAGVRFAPVSFKLRHNYNVLRGPHRGRWHGWHRTVLASRLLTHGHLVGAQDRIIWNQKQTKGGRGKKTVQKWTVYLANASPMLAPFAGGLILMGLERKERKRADLSVLHDVTQSQYEKPRRSGAPGSSSNRHPVPFLQILQERLLPHAGVLPSVQPSLKFRVSTGRSPPGARPNAAQPLLNFSPSLQ